MVYQTLEIKNHSSACADINYDTKGNLELSFIFAGPGI
jgi:hypothetical protein